MCGMNAQIIHESIGMAADCLVRKCGPDGRFIYRVNLDPEVIQKPRYNVLRHAGSMYALAMYHRSHRSEAVLAALVRAGRFLREHCIAPLPDREDLLAVWSRPEITGQKKPLQAKLGGSGLGLVALLGLDEIQPTPTALEPLRRLGRFVVHMQKEDGSFHSKYVPSQGGRQDKWTSLYYPGEAALGLLMLYERDPSPEWLESATDAIGYLARSREGSREVPADHWALLATAKLLANCDRRETALPRETIERHAIQVCDTILREQLWDGEDPRLLGGFTDDGRTTPSSTRLEALLAALVFLPQQSELPARITSSIHEGMSFLLRSQIREGEHKGAFPRAVRRLPLGHPRNVGAFNRRATEVRIDYVQHALCAMIQYRHVFDLQPANSR